MMHKCRAQLFKILSATGKAGLLDLGCKAACKPNSIWEARAQVGQSEREKEQNLPGPLAWYAIVAVATRGTKAAIQ